MQNPFTTSMLRAIITSSHTVNSPELFPQIWTYTARGVCILEARLSFLFSNLVHLINTCYDKGLKLTITHEVPLKYTAKFARVNVSYSFPTPASAHFSHLDCLEGSLSLWPWPTPPLPSTAVWPPLCLQCLWTHTVFASLPALRIIVFSGSNLVVEPYQI